MGRLAGSLIQKETKSSYGSRLEANEQARYSRPQAFILPEIWLFLLGLPIDALVWIVLMIGALVFLPQLSSSHSLAPAGGSPAA
jgi:hypothetical protein